MRTISIEGVGEVSIRKSSRAKRIILKVNHENEPIVIIPKYIPYIVGINFAKKNTTWLKSSIKKTDATFISDGMVVASEYVVSFRQVDTEKVSSRVSGNQIRVSFPNTLDFTNIEVQKEVKKAATRAIKRRAEDTLPSIIYSLATHHGYKYKSISVKNMRSRWGSCSSAGLINLNIWLVQLPDELIEYVCCHELAHLNNPHHQKSFWNELAAMVPDYKERRQKLKTYSPSLIVG